MNVLRADARNAEELAFDEADINALCDKNELQGPYVRWKLV